MHLRIGPQGEIGWMHGEIQKEMREYGEGQDYCDGAATTKKKGSEQYRPDHGHE